MAKHNDKQELKAAGAARKQTEGSDPLDFRALEDERHFGGDMEVAAETNLGVDAVQRNQAENEDEPTPKIDELTFDEHRYEEAKHTDRREPLDKLAKGYLSQAVDSLRRVPATALSEQFRGRLLVYRHMIGRLVASGKAKGEAAIVVGVVGALAVDGAGKVDAIVFLRQVMGQIMWSASMDIARLRRPTRDRDETREAPIGMRDMSDHADTIAGIAGPDTNPTAVLDEVDIYSSVESLHGFLSTVADTLADTEDERIYLRLESGLSYADERIDDANFPGGAKWEPVFDLDKAMDLQLVKNQESLKKRELQRADRRALQLKKLGEMYV